MAKLFQYCSLHHGFAVRQINDSEIVQPAESKFRQMTGTPPLPDIPFIDPGN
jgi:hypothetical protein